MTKRFRPLHELPLFASEEDIATALLGPGKQVQWRAVAPLLEGRGLPKIDGLMGGRYWPAVKAFFDLEYGLRDRFSPVLAPHQPAQLGTAHKRPRTTRT